MIGWYIGIAGIFIGIAGSFFFLKSALSLEGELKKSIMHLVIAATLYVIFSSIITIFGVLKYDITSAWWQTIPVLFFFSSIFFAAGANKLVRLLQDIIRDEKSKGGSKKRGD